MYACMYIYGFSILVSLLLFASCRPPNSPHPLSLLILHRNNKKIETFAKKNKDLLPHYHSQQLRVVSSSVD